MDAIESKKNVPDFNELLNEYRRISGRIIAAGKMATKSKCEDALMERYNIDRGAAHDIANTVEHRELSPIAPSRDAYYSINFKWAYGVWVEESETELQTCPVCGESYTSMDHKDGAYNPAFFHHNNAPTCIQSSASYDAQRNAQPNKP